MSILDPLDAYAALVAECDAAKHAAVAAVHWQYAPRLEAARVMMMTTLKRDREMLTRAVERHDYDR